MIAAVLLATGFSIVGKPVPEWPVKTPEKWVQGGPLTLSDLRGKVVLIRFFMDADCPLCRGTAPALNEFHRLYSSRGLTVVGMYTPKPRPRAVPADVVRRYVEAYGFEFPVAVDDDWSALRRLWLDRMPEAEYTSASLLIDRNGILRHVHEGGLYSKEVGDPVARRGYEEMRAAIERLLAEP
jgi:peroxiredoxin